MSKTRDDMEETSVHKRPPPPPSPYSSGLDVIELAFETALSSVEAKISKNHNEYSEKLTIFSMFDHIEHHDDSGIIVELEYEYDFELEVKMNILARGEICAAFVTSLFHYWENSAKRFVGRKINGCNFEILSSMMPSVNPDLKNVNLLNNTIKHGKSYKFTDRFRNRWSNIIKNDGLFKIGRFNHKDYICIDPETVREVIHIIRTSSPISS
ncbi:hypothetical protein [Aureimonas sp. Leaf454]|uniref:hypothetical protein n=1 Tax=Aureimonas sp. Leaf454 TaxID=1736381 RepID=UPI000AE7277F|nr:hypothetical protein [Aureimonas sp. Leaf454]